jgi:hypothetical protein
MSAETKYKKKNLSKREIEETILWLLTHRQSDVKIVLRNFRKLAPQKQLMLDKKLLYLVSILDLAVKNGKRGARCKSCGLPMHVKWIGCENPVQAIGANVASVKKLAAAPKKTITRKSGKK